MRNIILMLLTLYSITSFGEPSCMNLLIACDAAGMGRTRHELWRNCVRPIAEAKRSYKRLNVDPEDVQSCADRIQMHKPYYWRKGMGQQNLGS